MKADADITVADARQAYLSWNQFQQENLLESLSVLLEKDIYKYIPLISLFFQINNKLLPGYVGPDTPAGIYAYKPGKAVIYEAKLLHSKFRYQQEGVIKNFALESIYFQQQLIDGKCFCWVFHRSIINKKNLDLLKQKTKKISQWFLSRGLAVEFICLSSDEFKNNKFAILKQENKSIFMDCFYSEAVLLAGKYPLWWLVPPTKENEYGEVVTHIKQARFVDNEEYIDLGSIANFKLVNIVQYSVAQVQKIKQSPEVSLVKLLLIDHKASVFPVVDGVSCRLKMHLYSGDFQVEPASIVAEIMHEVFLRYADRKHILSANRLFLHLKNNPGKLNLKIIDSFLGDNSFNAVPSVDAGGIDKIISYLNFFKAVAYEVRQIFSNIVIEYKAQKSEIDPSVLSTANNMQAFLSDNADRVPLYNNKDNVDIILGRIQIKHETIDQTEELWSLVLEISEGNQRVIEGFSSMLGLLAWCWLNRVVNHSTQVSIDCPLQQVKQIEARYVLEVLMQQINPGLISDIPAEAFKNPVRPLQSLIFLNSVNEIKNRLSLIDTTDSRISYCEQLIINSWGDVCTRTYFGNEGVLNCLCQWMNTVPLDGMAKPQSLLVFGYGAGESTYQAQRVSQIYDECLSFFYHLKQVDGRFVVRIGDGFYIIYADNNILKVNDIGNKKTFHEFLELPLPVFQSTGLERLAFTDYPLQEIYQNNKSNVLQVFFQVINRNCHTWVVDEKGTLWTDVMNVYERESYITHWLYFFNNIRNRLKKINYQAAELPTLEINQISFNQLGGIELYSAAAENINVDKTFIDLQISIESLEGGDQLSLMCDGKRFDYQEFKQSVLPECIQYLSARITGEGRRPVYVTDIDVPLRLFNVIDRNDIQISHILKFKRNFEHRVNKMLDG